MAEHRQYLTELRAAVADGIAKGQTLQQMQASLTLDKYQLVGELCEWRTENIAGMHAILTARN